MHDYRPPLGDIRLVLDEISDITAICDLPGFEHVDVETIHGVLDELGRFVAEVVAPVNRIGDEQGCSVTDGVVTVPDEFGVAWDKFVESGWSAISQDPDYGGGGFPGAIQTVATELLATASRAWSMGPMLTVGAVEAIRVFGDEGLKETFLPKMVTSEWSGTMNLTEPQAGSDVGALTTRAVPQDDGTYRIFGTKIFITFGEHELTENIIQLVLARTPDSPPGTRGISLFIIPKYLVADDGSLGERNDYRCVSVEHKLGLHASPTCVLAYGDAGDGAVGYLLGDEHQGMKCMFAMMNNARLGVGIEGLAVTERALQQASDYAMERHQGRAIGGPAGEQAAIIRHADVRRMLLTMRAYTDAMRCLLYLNAATLDVAGRHPDADTRQRAAERAELLTPISKAWCTDLGVEMASVGIQVHGGYGYKPGDILVGKVTPKGDSASGPEEKLLRSIFGEKAIDVTDTSLKMPSGSRGIVVDVRVFNRHGIEKDERSITIERFEIDSVQEDKNVEEEILERNIKQRASLILKGSYSVRRY